VRHVLRLSTSCPQVGSGCNLGVTGLYNSSPNCCFINIFLLLLNFVIFVSVS